MYVAWTKLQSIPGFPTTQKCTLLPSSGLHCPAPFLRMKCESCLLESSSPASICPWTHLTCLTSLSCICDGCLPTWPYTPDKHGLLSHSLYRRVNTVAGYQQMLAKPGFSSVRYLWLLADGLHKNIITIRISEKRKLQNASSTQLSIQSYSKNNSNMKS